MASWAENGAIYDGPFTVEKLFTKNICHQAIFYNSQLFKRLGLFNIEYKVCADWDFNHRCFANVTTHYFDLIIAKFMAGGQSTKVVSDKFTNEDFVINLKRYYRISFGNKLFMASSNLFLDLAVKLFMSFNFFSSIYFLSYSLCHSRHKHKVGILKKYFVSIYNLKH
jgi:hypothetical protein